jgi:hydrogenase-4 transcriptional activator
MEKFNQIILDIWREACRHIQIDESLPHMAKILSQHMPLAQICIRQLDEMNLLVKTIAVGFTEFSHASYFKSTSCTSDQARMIKTWSEQAQVLHGRQSESDDTLIQLIYPFQQHDILIGNLGEQESQQSHLVLIAQNENPFEIKHETMLKILLEPFRVALENDFRLRETNRLREAAEADKKNLLIKLSRNELGDTIIGQNAGLKTVMDRVALIARSDVPVLIFGETGTGKELISRIIHQKSDRSEGPFIRVNCGAIPSELIDAQLFGHEKGAFTGAVESRQGWFERADGGTLFLDEVGEMSLEAQVRLLRILQDGWMERVGGKHALRVNVRIVLATHRDLASMVAAAKFREDLWYRISTFPIFLPPLRDRLQDLKALAEHFTRRSAIRFGLPAVLPDDGQIALLRSYSWPGNIRELATVIDRAALLGNGQFLDIKTALGWGDGMDPSRSEPEPEMPAPANWALDYVMRKHIQSALTQCKGKIEGEDGAAGLLHINPHTLRGRMRKLGIRWADYR